MEAIIASLPQVEEDQKEEIAEMITPSERQQLNTVKLQTDRLVIVYHCISTLCKFYLFIGVVYSYYMH